MGNTLNLSEAKATTMYNEGVLEGSSNTGGQLQLGTINYWPYYQTYHNFYPYPTYITPNKTETAYKVVKVLLDKKLAKLDTVKQLVTLIDAIAEVV